MRRWTKEKEYEGACNVIFTGDAEVFGGDPR